MVTENICLHMCARIPNMLHMVRRMFHEVRQLPLCAEAMQKCTLSIVTGMYVPASPLI